eukprot:TRINITY_DN75692_c0_g1_i1.p1 TRINITY_DN75692_c0_g1~~TRINITY_DN75692_c0_g1_i1.p1  ORF type:complete len:372 (-),score=39.10 TRINITY_DN75692_c0_g1_i1:172-1287(-)
MVGHTSNRGSGRKTAPATGFGGKKRNKRGGKRVRERQGLLQTTTPKQQHQTSGYQGGRQTQQQYRRNSTYQQQKNDYFYKQKEQGRKGGALWKNHTRNTSIGGRHSVVRDSAYKVWADINAMANTTGTWKTANREEVVVEDPKPYHPSWQLRIDKQEAQKELWKQQYPNWFGRQLYNFAVEKQDAALGGKPRRGMGLVPRRTDSSPPAKRHKPNSVENAATSRQNKVQQAPVKTTHHTKRAQKWRQQQSQSNTNAGTQKVLQNKPVGNTKLYRTASTHTPEHNKGRSQAHQKHKTHHKQTANARKPTRPTRKPNQTQRKGKGGGTRAQAAGKKTRGKEMAPKRQVKTAPVAPKPTKKKMIIKRVVKRKRAA